MSLQQRNFNQLWTYCNDVIDQDGDSELVCSSLCKSKLKPIFNNVGYFPHTFLAVEPEIFTQEISGFDRATNISGLMKQFQWNLVCGTYQSQGM